MSISLTLQKLLTNPLNRMTTMYDCAEVIRFCCIRNEDQLEEIVSFDNDLTKQITQHIEISDEYSYKLKVWMVLCNARAGHMRYIHIFTICILAISLVYIINCVYNYSRKSHLTEAGIYDTHFHLAKRTILVLTYFRQISAIFDACEDNIDRLTNFQKLSAKSMAIYLRNFLKTDFLAEYTEMRFAFQQIFTLLFDRVRLLDETVPEICVYCNEFVVNGELVCPDNHNMTRCCISMVQVHALETLIAIENFLVIKWFCVYLI